MDRVDVVDDEDVPGAGLRSLLYGGGSVKRDRDTDGDAAPARSGVGDARRLEFIRLDGLRLLPRLPGAGDEDASRLSGLGSGMDDAPDRGVRELVGGSFR